MHDFDYLLPNSLATATRMSAQRGSAVLAGGQSLLREMKLGRAMPRRVVDIGRIRDLRSIRASKAAVVIGATTTHDAVAGSATIQRALPALAALAHGIGDPQVRNRGTLGGAIATNDPAFDYPAALVALGATVETTSREIPAELFFNGKLRTALKLGEIIKAVTFPIPEKAAYVKLPNPALSGAIVGVMVARISGAVRVAVIGAGPNVFRATNLEQALTVDFSPRALENLKCSAEGLLSDVFASAEYRAAMVPVLAKRAVAACG